MTQPTALFLADILEDAGKPADIAEKCAAELRRLHAERTAADGVISDLVEKVRRLHVKRDALLEALKMMLEQFTKTPSTLKDSEARIKAHAAIKAAEGNA